MQDWLSTTAHTHPREHEFSSLKSQEENCDTAKTVLQRVQSMLAESENDKRNVTKYPTGNFYSAGFAQALAPTSRGAQNNQGGADARQIKRPGDSFSSTIDEEKIVAKCIADLLQMKVPTIPAESAVCLADFERLGGEEGEILAEWEAMTSESGCFVDTAGCAEKRCLEKMGPTSEVITPRPLTPTLGYRIEKVRRGKGGFVASRPPAETCPLVTSRGDVFRTVRTSILFECCVLCEG